MGKATLQSKFVPVNLNKSYGQDISTSSSSSSSSFGPVIIQKARPHGGMVLLTRPSSSSSSTHHTPKLGTPPLVNLHKENAKNALAVSLIGASSSSVWSRQQPPIASRSNVAFLHTSPPTVSPDSTLAGSYLSHMKENTSLISQSANGKLPLVPLADGSNDSTCTSPLPIYNKYDPNHATHKHAEGRAVLREEDFPSLQINCLSPSLHPQQIESDVQQKQKVQCSVQEDEQKNLLPSCQQQMHLCELGAHLLFQHHLCIHSLPAQPLETTMPIRQPSTAANEKVYSRHLDDNKPEKSVATPDENWADDEREILHQGSIVEEFPSNRDKGLWRLAWESQFEFETRAKDCRLVTECLSRQFSFSKDRMPLTYGTAADFGNKMDVFCKSNVLDSNLHAKDNTWNLDKLRRSLCASAKGRCLQGEASGSYLRWILEHRMLGNAKSDFDMDSIVGLDLKARRRKKEEAEGAAFKDLARESFEAELERVQQMLEQERTQVFNGEDEAFRPEKKDEVYKVPRKEQGDEKEFLIEKELQLEHKEDTKNAAERVEKKLREVAKGALSAREEEKKKMLEEEEKRKERAFKKLLDLEERIARREADKSLVANAKLHSSMTSDCKHGAAQSELSFSCKYSPIQEQLHRSIVDDISVTMPFSLNKNLLDSSVMSGSMAAEQKLVSLSTPCFPQDGDIVSAVSQGLLEKVQVSLPSRKKEDLSVNNLSTPLYLEDKDLLVGIRISDDNDGKETPESIDIGAYSSMTDVPNDLQIFEKPKVVASESCLGGSELYQQDCNELIEKASMCDLEGLTQHKRACVNLVSKHSSVIESDETWLEQGEKKSVELVTADGSSGERRLEVDYADSQKDGTTNVKAVLSNIACEDLQRQLQDFESGEVVAKYSVVKEEFRKPFRELLPNMIEKTTTNIDLKSCYQEIREELVQQSSLLLHVNQAAEVMQQDAFSSRQFSVQGAQQPLSIIPANDLDNQQETFFQLPMGLNSAAPFMLHAIQIGSIQMPLVNTDSCMPQRLPLHDSQASLLQFGQLYSTSADQLSSTVQLTLPVDYVAGQAHEHHEIEAEACVQQGAKSLKDWGQIYKSNEEPPASSGKGQIPCQAASTRASTLQFGQLFSTLLYKPLSIDPSFSCLDEAKEKPPQLEVQAESLCLQGLASNSLENCNRLSNSAEESHVPSSNSQLLQHNNSIARYGYNDRVEASERNQANLMGQEGEKLHSQSNDDFRTVQICPIEKAFPFLGHYNLCLPGRKKKGSATTCARVLERRYWRASTVKMKHVEVSPSITLPGLGDHKTTLHGKLSRYVYRKKKPPGNNEQQEYKINQQPTQALCSDLLQNQESEKAGPSQTEKAVFMCKNNDTICDLLHTRMLKKQQSTEVMPIEYGVFEQQGMGTIDDFIEVKSRRQILRKPRKEEQETKAKSKTFRQWIADQENSEEEA